MYNLQGKNYIFTVMPTCKQILGEACVAVASKTKKNILITIQVRRCDFWKHRGFGYDPAMLFVCLGSVHGDIYHNRSRTQGNIAVWCTFCLLLGLAMFPFL